MADFASIKSGFKRVGTAAIDPICKLIASVGILAMVLIASYTLLSPLQVGALAIIIPIGAYTLGYVMQGIVLLLAHHKPPSDYSYEGTQKFFIRGYAIIPLFVSLIFAALMQNVYYEYFLVLMHKGLLAQFDSYSLQPYACAVATFLCSAAGIVVQFFPYGRLMSMRVMVTCIGIGILGTFFTSGSPIVGILFAVYAACTVILMNQSYIMRSYKSLVVTKISTSARMYSLRIMLLCIVLSILGGIIVFIALNGLYRVLLFLLYLTVFTIVKDSSQTQQTTSQAVNDIVFEGDKIGELTNKMSLVGFILMAVFAILFFIFGKNASFKGIIDTIVRWFEEFVALFMGSREHVREPELNFKDEVETLNKVKASRMQTALARSGSLTLREFNSEMSALKTDSERLSYSYIVMIRLLNTLNPSLRASDTPRELSEKIGATMNFPEIDGITDLIERMKYAKELDDPIETKRVLGDVRRMVEHHLT